MKRPKLLFILTTLPIVFSLLFLLIYGNSFFHSLYLKMNNFGVEENPWKYVPKVELTIRMNSKPAFVKLYKNWFLKSLKLFWPEDWLNLTLVMDDEKSMDHFVGNLLSKSFPWPKIVYLGPGDSSVYQGNQRRRMYLDYFFPERYVRAEFVGFIDADTMFTTVVTPQSLFDATKTKPVVQALIGEPYWQEHWECWSVVTERMLARKEALRCMSYFPVIVKVRHIITMRKYIENVHKKTFMDVFNESLQIENAHFRGTKLNDCMCQFSVICNYIWYFHREEYDFYLQMVPDDTWDGEGRVKSQVTADYTKKIDPRYKIPKPRIAIHSRHYIQDGKYVSDSSLDTLKDPVYSQLERRLVEGVCLAIGFDHCPEICNSFDREELQMSLFSFERFEWFWDNRCIVEQKKHYQNVKELIAYNEKNYKRMFGVQTPHRICEKTFLSAK